MSLVGGALEATWLYHELGRCHLELTDFPKAQACAKKALAAATLTNDSAWLLNTQVLLAQAQGNLGNQVALTTK